MSPSLSALNPQNDSTGSSTEATYVSKKKGDQLPPLFFYMEMGYWDKAIERATTNPREAKTWTTVRSKSVMENNSNGNNGNSSRVNSPNRNGRGRQRHNRGTADSRRSPSPVVASSSTVSGSPRQKQQQQSPLGGYPSHTKSTTRDENAGSVTSATDSGSCVNSRSNEFSQMDV